MCTAQCTKKGKILQYNLRILFAKTGFVNDESNFQKQKSI